MLFRVGKIDVNLDALIFFIIAVVLLVAAVTTYIGGSSQRHRGNRAWALNEALRSGKAERIYKAAGNYAVVERGSLRLRMMQAAAASRIANQRKTALKLFGAVLNTTHKAGGELRAYALIGKTVMEVRSAKDKMAAFQKAIPALRKAAKMAPKLAEPHANLGSAWLGIATLHKERARRFLGEKKESSETGGAEEARKAEGEAEKAFGEAQKAFDKAIELSKRKSRADKNFRPLSARALSALYRGRGMIHTNKNDVEAAYKDFRAGFALDPKGAEKNNMLPLLTETALAMIAVPEVKRHRRGMLLERIGREKWLEKLDKKRRYEALVRMGQAYRYQGDVINAPKHFKMARSLAPERAECALYEAQLFLAQAREFRKEYAIHDRGAGRREKSIAATVNIWMQPLGRTLVPIISARPARKHSSLQKAEKSEAGYAQGISQAATNESLSRELRARAHHALAELYLYQASVFPPDSLPLQKKAIKALKASAELNPQPVTMLRLGILYHYLYAKTENGLLRTLAISWLKKTLAADLEGKVIGPEVAEKLREALKEMVHRDVKIVDFRTMRAPPDTQPLVSFAVLNVSGEKLDTGKVGLRVEVDGNAILPMIVGNEVYVQVAPAGEGKSVKIDVTCLPSGRTPVRQSFTLTSDRSPPTIEPIAPLAGAAAKRPYPVLKMRFVDPSGVDPTSISISMQAVLGRSFTKKQIIQEGRYLFNASQRSGLTFKKEELVNAAEVIFTSRSGLSAGDYEAHIEVSDLMGNRTEKPIVWRFAVQ